MSLINFKFHKCLSGLTGLGQTILPMAVALGLGILYYFFLHIPREEPSSTNRKKRRPSVQQPMYNRPSRIHLVTTAAEWDEIFPELELSIAVIRAVGLDCEWVTRGRNTRPVALVQIAADDGLVVLVRMCLLDKVPDSLSHFLADRSVLKVGVAVNDDAARLYKDYCLHVSGCVDLRHVITRVRNYQCEYLGLEGLTATVLGRQLPKSPRIRCGNWEVASMHQEQITYAANDALAAIDIFVWLMLAKIHKKIPSPSARQQTSCKSINTMAMSAVQGLLDLPYKASKKHTRSTDQSNPGKGKPQTSYQRQKRDSIHAFSPSRQMPFYHNCRLLAPDGQALCTTSEGKIQWYLDKGLAEKVSCDPLTARLSFEPSGRPDDVNDYYLHAKENVCVACGGGGTYIRKQVVPHEYRKYFPDVMKDHLSHDVVLLCPSCHALSCLHDSRLRQKLVTQCSAPLNCGTASKTKENSDLQKIKSAARALKQSYNRIPVKRRKFLEQQIMDFYGIATLSESVIDRAIDLDDRVQNATYISHGEMVVTYYRDHGGLMSLELLWRQHFVETMQPAFLPPMWSVHHNHQRLTHVQS